jgi:hypothetical protein
MFVKWNPKGGVLEPKTSVVISAKRFENGVLHGAPISLKTLLNPWHFRIKTDVEL